MAEKLPRDLRLLRLEIERNLAATATAYYRIGITEYLNAEARMWESYQAAVGNLAIAIELMLKAFVARNCFRKLYVGLPDELDIFLSQTETPPPSVSLRPFEDALRSFEQKTIELNQAIAIYEIYFPDKKLELHSYFNFLATTRNVSVHGALPDFQRHDLTRVSYLAISLIKHLEEQRILTEPADLALKTKDIQKRFDRERVERVTKKIRAARQIAKRLTGKRNAIFTNPNDFEELVLPCPICSTDIVTAGYTEEKIVSEDDAFLTYFLNEFRCSECGLEIDDPRDLRLVGLSETHDRSDQWDEWSRQNSDWV
jgi:hypothetical protein